MTLEELYALRKEINEFHAWATKAPTWTKVLKLRTEAAEHNVQLDGIYDVVLWIADTIKYLERPKAAPSVKPIPINEPVDSELLTLDRIPLKLILKEIHESGHKFPNSTNPSQCIRFCSPLDGKWDLTYGDLNPSQQGLFRYIKMDYEKTLAAKGMSPKYYELIEY